jgi:putative zinc finger/helix-turn-helix YgiT family protein
MIEHLEGGTQVCALCGANAARLTTERMSFVYGEHGAAVTLQAEAPVWACAACGERYTADGAEAAERAAICAHLGRLAPSEIVQLRKVAGLTQEAFARAVGVGRVTLARWETGQQMQSAVYDRLIREHAERASRAMRPQPLFRTNIDHRRSAAPKFELVPA